MGKARQVYCTFCGQTFFSSDVETCSLCRKTGGLVDPMSPEAMENLVAKKQADPTGKFGDALGTAVETALLGRRLIRLSAAGAFALILGVFLIAHPDLRENPNSVSLRDCLVSFGAIFVGIILLGAAYLMWRNAKETAAGNTKSKSGQPDDKK